MKIIAVILLVVVNIFAVEVRINPRNKDWSHHDSSFGFFVSVVTDNQRPQQVEPLQVIYLIDVSQRFAGNVRQEFINGGMEILKRLADSDFFGIVLYSEFSRTLLPLSEIGSTGRDRINAMLSEISTERGRDPLSALDRVVSEFSQNSGRRCDGKSLVMSVLGETDEDGEGNFYDKKMIEAMDKLGVQIYTIGHGDDFDENAAINAAEETGGRAYFSGRDRADLIKNRFEVLGPHLVNPNTKDIRIEFSTRDGIKTAKFKGEEINTINIPKLSVGDTVNIFLELRNIPGRRSSDIDVDFDYNSINMRSNLSTSTSFRVNTVRGNSSYAEKAPQFIKYQILFNMAQTIDELKIGDKSFRREYADGFRRLLETRLVHIRNEINTREIQQVFVEMVSLYDAIVGGTASDSLIAKQVKYMLHYCSFNE